MTVEDVERLLKTAEAYKEIKLLDLQRAEDYIIKLRRKKWWLSYPEVAVIYYVPMWETDYAHPTISWQSIVDINGQEICNVNTIEYPALESEITDEKTVLTVRNPFLCT